MTRMGSGMPKRSLGSVVALGLAVVLCAAALPTERAAHRGGEER